MAKNTVKKDKPAQELLLDFMKKNGLEFYVRKQQVRYLEDNGMVIEPPSIVVFYKDQVKKNKIDIKE